MTEGVVTLKERHRRRMERMARAIVEIDAALAAYAREHGGRFLRYGSTATGRMRMHSDVDIIADFAGESAGPATTYAEDVCFARQMKPDVFSSAHVSERFKAAISGDAVVLS